MPFFTRRLQPLWLIGAATAFACAVAAAPYAQEGAQGGGAAAGKPGCPFKALTAKVSTIFGAYDRAMSNSGALEGVEIPGVAKVRELTVYTCAFQRTSTREALQIIANVYPSVSEAVSAFTEASKTKSAAGPFYTASRQVGKMQVFEGPGRSLSAC